MSTDAYCRLCGTLSEPLIDIVSENEGVEGVNTLFKIQTTLRVLITKSDKLSHRICLNCADKVHEYYLFAKKCQQTQINLFDSSNSQKSLFIWKITDGPKPKENVTEDESSVENETITFLDLETVDPVESNVSITPETDPLNVTNCDPQINQNTSITDSGNKKISYSRLVTFLRSQIKVNSENENSMPQEKSKILKKILALKSKNLVGNNKISKKKKKPIKDKNRVKCPYCGEFLIRDEFETEHMFLHTDDPALHRIILEHVAPSPVVKQFDCKECKIPFNRELSYLEHLNQHNNYRPVKCHICDRQFFGHKKTRAHVRTAHLVSIFKCESCTYVAKTPQDLQKHQRGVHSGERIVCNICGKLFSAFDHNMKKHLQTHNETRPFKCDVCGIGFKTRASVARHRENIHFPVSVMCFLCGTICGSKQKHKKHYYKCRKKNKKMDMKIVL